MVLLILVFEVLMCVDINFHHFISDTCYQACRSTFDIWFCNETEGVCRTLYFYIGRLGPFCLFLDPFSACFTKWSNTLKQFIDNLSTNCLSVFNHFVGLALKVLNEFHLLCHPHDFGKLLIPISCHYFHPPPSHINTCTHALTHQHILLGWMSYSDKTAC